MSPKPGDVVKEMSVEDYWKQTEISRLLSKNGGWKKKAERPSLRKIARAHPKLLALMIAGFVFSIGAYGASLTLFVQPVPAHGILLTCPSAVPSRVSVLINSTGFILVNCNGNGVLEALAGTQAIANYSLPSPYLDVYIYPIGQDNLITSKCSDVPAALDLSRPITFGYRGNWSLCADYGPVGPNGLPGFTIGWVTS